MNCTESEPSGNRDEKPNPLTPTTNPQKPITTHPHYPTTAKPHSPLLPASNHHPSTD